MTARGNALGKHSLETPSPEGAEPAPEGIYYFVEAERSVIAAVVDARRHPRLIRDAIRTRR